MSTFVGECHEDMMVNTHKRNREMGEGKLKFEVSSLLTILSSRPCLVCVSVSLNTTRMSLLHFYHVFCRTLSSNYAWFSGHVVKLLSQVCSTVKESESEFLYSVLLWNNHLPIRYHHRHRVGVQPIGCTGCRLGRAHSPGLQLTAMPRPDLPFNSRHPRDPWNYMDHYSFTDPGGMEGWVGLVGWPIAKWSHVNHGSGVGQAKSASYRPTS